MLRMTLLVLALAGALAAADHTKPAEARGENGSVVIQAKAYPNPEAVKELLGSDLGGYYIVLAVQVAPRFGKQVAISVDDFVLKTDKDGEKSSPFRPSQIAGRGALVISGKSNAPPQAHSGAKEKDNPMLQVLAEKQLPETKTDQPVSGLLYFPMQKQRAKDLELRYNAASDDKIVMRFR